MSFAFTTDDLATLGPEQKSAIIEALVIAVLADGRAPAEETAQFDREVGAIPWGMEDPEVRRHLEAARRRLLELSDVEAANALVLSIAERLPTPALREKTLHAVANILYATKKMNRPGAVAFGAFASAFQTPQERLDAIKASVKGK